jgi:hypothetical protein
VSGRHRPVRRYPRWIGLTIMALFAIVLSVVVAPLVARADVMPPGPPHPPGSSVGRVPVTPCAVTAGWGSTPQVNPPMTHPSIVSVRAGRHACFDRLVFHTNGTPGGWTVMYVDIVTADPSGKVLVVPGGALLQVTIRNPGIDGRGNPTFGPLPTVAGFTTLRSIVNAGAFEGLTSFGVGVRAHLPFRVFALTGPGGNGMVVLDVAHRWAS